MNDIVIGLNLGDEGKGITVARLCEQNRPYAVVRFSGGPQTAHNVITADGKHHTFAQFGSGTLQGVPTILSRFMMVNPLNMCREADHIESLVGFDPFGITTISKNALLVTPIHRFANQKREINRGVNAHGSCGQGIGETMSFAVEYPHDAPRVGDLLHLDILERKMDQYRTFIEAELGAVDAPLVSETIAEYAEIMATRNVSIVDDEEIAQMLKRGYHVFEGSQGVLLDEWLGFHPHTTWSTTTSQNAQELLSDAGLEPGRVIGATRTYTTRHGHGPLPGEFEGDDWVDTFPEEHNKRGRFQGAWRGSHLDLLLLDYAVAANKGIDAFSVTHCDRDVTHVIEGYEGMGTIIPDFRENLEYQEKITNLLIKIHGRKAYLKEVDSESILGLLEARYGVPVIMKSHGPRINEVKYK
jgi:adenylosuccinate synthase